MAAHAPNHSTSPLRFDRRAVAHRRGNSLILVTAILVLLVIVAAAFLSRTQAGRQVSTAQQQSIQREERVEPIANAVVGMVGDALFPQPIDPTTPTRTNPNDPNMAIAISAYPRLAIEPNAQIFGIDRDFFPADVQPDFGYNAAPYESRPWTNWPDFLNTAFPRGQGQPDGTLLTAAGLPISDGNPLGNPGMGDSRWHRSTEPLRIDVDPDGLPDGFSHWEHLTWLATANNGFRWVTDTSNLFDTALNPRLISDELSLGVPYEQWLSNAAPTPLPNGAAWTATTPGGKAAAVTEFRSRALNWATNYPNAYKDGTQGLPNFFRLSDLATDVDPALNVRRAVERTFADTDGDGFTDAFWFLAPASVDQSTRYLVAASVVDNSALLNVNVATRANPWNTSGATPADLALVGNSGTNGESIGFFDNPGNGYDGAGTSYSLFTAQDVNNKIFNPAYISYYPILFGTDPTTPGPTFLKALGIRFTNGTPNPSFMDESFQDFVDNLAPALGDVRAKFYSPYERLQYWKSSALAAGAAQFGLTPFGLEDELELRSFHGQNNPWLTTRLESAVNGVDQTSQFLRSTPFRGEISEHVFQLNNRQLMLDNRRKLTTVNGARNDLAPAWLWPSPNFDPRIDYDRGPDGMLYAYYQAALGLDFVSLGHRFVVDTDNDLVIDGVAPALQDEMASILARDQQAYARQKQKIDLRRAFTDPVANTAFGGAEIFERQLNWRNDIQQLLERTLTRVWVDGTAAGGPTPAHYQSYLGRSENATPNYQYQQFRKTLHMAASMAANISQWRDGPDPTALLPFDGPLHPWVGTSVPEWVEPTSKIRYIGQERQPFLMEVFLGFVYPKSQVSTAMKAALLAEGYAVNNDYQVPNPIKSAGEAFVDSSTKPGIVIAVQVGNPTELPLNLGGFALRIDGRSFVFPPNSILPPTTRERPSTAIVYAIREANDDNSGVGQPGYFTQASWANFLDVQTNDLAQGSLVFNATGQLLPGSLVMLSPAEYGSPSSAPFHDVEVELVRRITWPDGIGPPPGDPTGLATVVVDRIDDPNDGGWNFKEAVNRLLSDDTRRPPKQDFNITDPDIDRWWMNGVRIKNDDYLVAYARVARPWTWDVPQRIQEVGSNVAVGQSDGIIRSNELNPRYIFAFSGDARPKDTGDLPDLDMQQGSSTEVTFQGDTYAFEDAPDGNGADPASLWITYDYTDIYGAKERDGVTDRPLRRGKPTFFPCVTRKAGQNNVYPVAATFPTLVELLPNIPVANLAPNAAFPKGTYDPFNIGDKGLKSTDWEKIYKAPPAGSPPGNPGTTKVDAFFEPLQMNIKDDDFEQIGELLNVFCWGPVLDCTTSFFTPKTVRTFSEIMMQSGEGSDQPAGRGAFVNRLRITPYRDETLALKGILDFSPTDGPTPMLAPPVEGTAPNLPSNLLTGLIPWEGGSAPTLQQQAKNRELSKLVGRSNMPALPAGVGLFEGVVCDDRGWRFALEDKDQEVFRQRNAAGYSGEVTPGLINLTTAMPEVMRALPHGTVILNNDSSIGYVNEYGVSSLSTIGSAANPLTRVVDSIQRYRDRTTATSAVNYTGTIVPSDVGLLNAPDYFERGFDFNVVGIDRKFMPPFTWNTLVFSGLRADRGFQTIGELLLTQRVTSNLSAASWNVNKSYSIEFAGLDPYKVGGAGAPPFGSYAAIETPRFASDRTNGRASAFPPPAVVTDTDMPLPRVVPVQLVPDRVGGDAEERNMLFASMSNLVSVRSDIFTVYLRIKAVRQDPTNGRWDATDPNLVSGDSRYVMVIDRSSVKKPGDKPRILAFQKVDLPN